MLPPLLAAATPCCRHSLLPPLDAAASALLVVAQRTCAYRLNEETYDLWIKLPGLALRNGNCHCYAMGSFKGESCLRWM
jgi:hypothetical protein